jgi:hypothetical protein
MVIDRTMYFFIRVQVKSIKNAIYARFIYPSYIQ